MFYRKRRNWSPILTIIVVFVMTWFLFEKIRMVDIPEDCNTPVVLVQPATEQSLQIKEPPLPKNSQSDDEFRYVTPPKAGLGTILEEHNRLDLFLSSQGVVCRNLSHFGGKYWGSRPPPKWDPDGLWYVCLDPEVGLIPGKCIVYSVGINKDWSFDEAIADYGCRVYSFDPTINKPNHFHTPKIQFFNLGLAEMDQEGTPGAVGRAGWKTRTLATLIKELGHKDRFIDILKVDIESNEWKTLPQMLADGTAKKYVKQFDLEFHIHGYPAGRRLNYGIIMWLDRQGFKVVNFHKNMHCGNCYEVTFINTNLVKIPIR